MKSRIVLTYSLFFLLLMHSDYLLSNRSNNTKTVLILFEGSPDVPAYKPILDGIRLQLYKAFTDFYNLHVEFLEIGKYPDGNYPKENFILLNEKYRDIKPDLLICIQKNVIKILKDYAESYLLDLPTITFDLDYTNYGYLTDLSFNDSTTSIGLKFNIEKSISTALDFFPETSSIYFISGVSPFDKIMLQISLQAVKNFDGQFKVEVMTDLAMDEILQKVHQIQDSSLICIPVFITDKKLVPYYNPEAINIISREAHVPVIILSDMGMGEGAFGGYMLSFTKSGLLTGNAAVDILNGKDPNSINITEADYSEYIFDYRELKRWNLENSELIPTESIILFKPNNPFDKYKWIVGAVLLFLVLQTLLIANLIRLNRNQKTLTKKMVETESKYRGFLHEDRSLRLGQMAASLSHELNQPLTAVLSTAQAGINFINSNEASPALLKQILQKIVENNKRTASILSSIRGMLKLENREKEKIDLNDCISELVEVYESEAKKQNTKINVTLVDNPVYIIADKIQIQQVLLNLIFNAAEVMEVQNTANRMIDIIQNIKNGDVIISVRDHGKGIDDSIKDRIFKPFVTSRVDGSGIGLSICKSIIEDHNGKIWVENKPDGGAEFFFSLKVYNNE